MTLGRNLLAGLANSIWSALIGFAVVPFYLKYLGIEAYGLIGFFMTLQVMFQLLDMGLASAANRELARFKATNDPASAGELLHSLAVIYWSIAALIVLVVFALAPVIAQKWLGGSSLPRDMLVNSIMLMGAVIAARWPIALYQGALLGAQQMIKFCVLNMSMVALSSGGAILILASLSSTIEAFFCWQVMVGIVYALVIKRVAWTVLGSGAAPIFSAQVLKKIWRYSAGMTLVTAFGLVFSQVDKIILSRALSLENFGQYVLATVVVSSLYILISPVFNVVFPRFSWLVARDEKQSIERLYLQGTQLMACVLFPAAGFLGVHAEGLVLVWTGSQAVAKNAAVIIALLAAGSMLHGIMHFPYALQLAYGKLKIAIWTYVVQLVIAVPMLVFFTDRWGAVGGAAAWLGSMSAYFALGVAVTHRTLLKAAVSTWLLKVIVVPVSITGVYVVAFMTLGRQADIGLTWEIILGLIGAALTVAGCIAVSADARAMVWTRLRGVFF